MRDLQTRAAWLIACVCWWGCGDDDAAPPVTASGPSELRFEPDSYQVDVESAHTVVLSTTLYGSDGEVLELENTDPGVAELSRGLQRVTRGGDPNGQYVEVSDGSTAQRVVLPVVNASDAAAELDYQLAVVCRAPGETTLRALWGPADGDAATAAVEASATVRCLAIDGGMEHGGE